MWIVCFVSLCCLKKVILYIHTRNKEEHHKTGLAKRGAVDVYNQPSDLSLSTVKGA